MKKTIKTACVVLMIFVTVFFAAACGGASPGEAVTNMLSGIKERNTRAISDYYLGNAADFKESAVVKSFTVGYDSLNISQKKTLKAFTAKLLGFDYKVGKEKINGKTATVKVSVNTYDFYTAMNNIMVEYRKQAVKDSLAGETINDGKLTEALVSAVKTETGKLTAKNKTASVEFKLTRVRGKWRVNELSKKQLDTLYGGLAKSITAINKNDKRGGEK